MSVVGVNQTVNNASSTAKFATEKSSTDDRDQFLLLLTTQLQNQDPTNPADTNQVTQQIAALSQVEQQTKTNGYLEELIGLFTQSQANDALNYIGRRVDAAGNTAELKDGSAYINYSLPTGVSKVDVTITNDAGRVVYNGLGTALAGRNLVAWDGKNSFTDEDMQDGVYTFDVTAYDDKNEEIAVNTLISGIVRSLDTEVDGTQRLSLGGYSVPIADVLSVYSPEQTG